MYRRLQLPEQPIEFWRLRESQTGLFRGPFCKFEI
ncbi:hypothetical protein GGE12_001351 [Rhizobium mongolense]|uniref:Uncharacterized protein n=1 Tax=Rhizobium mongolense TaxID=57676 RepID=A0A7W6RJG3_9HYPH|nr:hypothetical protein [Rhizobium mongolense]